MYVTVRTCACHQIITLVRCNFHNILDTFLVPGRLDVVRTMTQHVTKEDALCTVLGMIICVHVCTYVYVCNCMCVRMHKSAHISMCVCVHVIECSCGFNLHDIVYSCPNLLWLAINTNLLHFAASQGQRALATAVLIAASLTIACYMLMH